MYTSNLTFPFEKSKYPLIQKLKFIQDLILVKFFFHFSELEALSGKTKDKYINLTSYHLFNAIPSIIKIWHFFQERFCRKEKNTKMLVNFVKDGHGGTDFCRNAHVLYLLPM